MLKFYSIKTLLFIAIFFVALFDVNAQSYTVSGTITDNADGLTMPGVSIFVKGTKVGATTDFDGKFTLKTFSGTDTLTIQSIGYTTKIIPINNQAVINITLSENRMQVNEIVVTALGVKREKKSLGYSVQEVNGKDLQNNKEVSVINSLSGKVAGLQVSSTNGGAGSSSRIVLRGNNSFNNNQALIVVDGVPIDNSTVSNSSDEWGGKDFGNGVGEINPDDIESISVLKGASASALYGSRASNGVILITTKKGKERKGLGVTFSTSTTIDQAYIHKNFQNKYGAGSNGSFNGGTHWSIDSTGTPHYFSDQGTYFSSWGPEMNDQEIYDWDGNKSTFSANPDNYKNYFQTGYTTNNSVSVFGGKKDKTYRFTASDMRNSDIVPNTSINRTNISANANYKFFNSFVVQGFVSYVSQKADNRLGLADSHTNVARNYILMPRNISSESLENNMMGSDGKEETWYSVWNWQTNPYWNQNYELSFDKKDRVFGNASVNYIYNENLNLLIRTSLDKSWHHFENIGAYNGMINPNGSFSFKDIERWQTNSDFLFTYSKKINEDIKVVGNIGGSSFYNKTLDYSENTNIGLSEPYNYSIENSIGAPNRLSLLWEKASNSLYSFARLEYKNFLFFDITGRNDWSSTLPEDNNSYFYPSISSGFVFTELLDDDNTKRKKIFPYGKLRASWAKVGNDTEPYILQAVYTVDTNNTYNTVAHINRTIANNKLEPEELVSIEVGTDLRFFENIIAIDFSYYHTNSYNQIIRMPISATSGAQFTWVNAGNIMNDGIELQIKAKVVEKPNFQWNMIVNYNKNKSEVIELADGVENYQLLSHWGLSIEARPGNPYGDIVGYGMKKDENGNKLINEYGMYERTDTSLILGNINPDFSISLHNSFTYKKWTFDFLIDGKFGGEMFSGTNMYGNGYAGNFEESLEGREEWYASEAARIKAGVSPEDWNPTGGALAEGVYADGTIINGVDVSGQENKTYVNPYLYWTQFSEWTKEIHEPFVYSASFIKLRQLSLTYNLPKITIRKMKISNVSLSVIARNVWLIWSKVPNIDPESFHTNGNGQGYELYSYPTVRSIGLSLNVKF